MDAMQGCAFYKGWIAAPFKPGKFYDVEVTIKENELFVSAQKEPKPGKNRPTMHYEHMSDFYYDWVFAYPGDQPEYPDIPIVHQVTKYGWTKSCAILAEAYAQALKAVNNGIDQCDELYAMDELSYLLRTRDALRAARPHLAKMLTKPIIRMD